MNVCMHTFFFLPVLLFVIVRSVMTLPFCHRPRASQVLREEKMLLSTFDTCFQNGKHLFMLLLSHCYLGLMPYVLEQSQPGIICLCWSLIFLSPIITRRKNIFSSFFSPRFLFSPSFVLRVVEGSLRLCRCRSIQKLSSWIELYLCLVLFQMCFLMVLLVVLRNTQEKIVCVLSF